VVSVPSPTNSAGEGSPKRAKEHSPRSLALLKVDAAMARTTGDHIQGRPWQRQRLIQREQPGIFCLKKGNNNKVSQVFIFNFFLTAGYASLPFPAPILNLS
jgi:hypothetical protein